MVKSNNHLINCFERNKNKCAVVTNFEKVTFNQIKVRSFELISFFKKKGIRRGQVIAVKLPNSIELIYCYFACIFGGYIICPINNELSNLETKKIVKSVKSKYFINNIKKIGFIKTKKNFFENYNEKKIMGIFLTSGTTSLPKGICHNSKTLITNAMTFNKKNKITCNRFYHLFPMSYMAGFLNSVLSPLIAGGTIILKEKFNIRFAINFFDILKINKIDYLWLNPTMIKAINHFQKKRKKLYRKLKVFVGTAALISKDKKEFFKKFSILPLESYGMTEILLFSSQEKNKHSYKSNVGTILKGCKIVKNNKKKLLIKSNYINKWIYNLSKKKFERVKNFKNFDTGDLGYLDNSKNLNIVGRTKNIIIKGGQNINPESIEKKINQLKIFSEICVVPIKDKFFGEDICFLIKTHKDRKINFSKIEKLIEQNFTRIEFPKKIIHVRSIPKNKNFKIQRNNLLSILKSKPRNILYEKNY